ncbi:hypothetical protein FHS72_003212 [Loktanella ponticola]|uniref:Uncharacterized protein n=1 Tax=Yoonia ponticola TaxID=1524255 RepID=A0A7W9BN23_9RHOB|nr:hypothetical protein [Yoonia ponticola]MBB5723567.1 hypothetical protein [Yoonia ponticola]
MNDEATPIARLIGPDGKSIVGLVYVWETSELAILWLNPRKTAAFVDPKIGASMWATAKSRTPEDVIALLGRLQTLAKQS